MRRKEGERHNLEIKQNVAQGGGGGRDKATEMVMGTATDTYTPQPHSGGQWLVQNVDGRVGRVHLRTQMQDPVGNHNHGKSMPVPVPTNTKTQRHLRASGALESDSETQSEAPTGRGGACMYCYCTRAGARRVRRRTRRPDSATRLSVAHRRDLTHDT
jgi:hypothetical protein